MGITDGISGLANFFGELPIIIYDFIKETFKSLIKNIQNTPEWIKISIGLFLGLILGYLIFWFFKHIYNEGFRDAN